MRRRTARSRRPAGALGTAGWLFAELALVLAVVALGSESPSSGGSAAPTTSAPVPTTEAPANPSGLSLTTTSFRMNVRADGAGVVEEFGRRLTDTVGPDARVGLVLVFGVSRVPGVPTAGTEVSGLLKSLVASAGIPQLRSTVDIRDYMGTDGAPGDAVVELFLLNGGP